MMMNKSIEHFQKTFKDVKTPLQEYTNIMFGKEAEASCALDGETQFLDENGKLYGATPEQQEEFDRRNKEWKERRKEVIGKSISFLSKNNLGNSIRKK